MAYSLRGQTPAQPTRSRFGAQEEHILLAGWIAAMTEINAEAVRLVKKAAKEKFGTDVTDNEAEQAIVDYFDSTIAPPDITQDQIEEIVESMWGDDSY